jgi:iron complex outermembrane receptor protein
MDARGATTMPTTGPSDSDFGEPAAAPVTALPAEDAPELDLYKDMPIVVAAAKRQQTQRQAASAVTVVTADDIALFGDRSLGDVLRTQRGFYLNSDGLNWFAGVRGFLRPDEWNARILVLVDGRPTREIIYDQTHIDEDFVVPLEAVKQIEIIRGPGSSLYGTDAVFGVVNIVTKSGADINGVQTTVTAGTQDTARVNSLFGFVTRGDWDILGDLSGYNTNGDHSVHFDGVTDAAHDYGTINNSDYQNTYSGFFKAAKGEFTATLDFENRLQGNRDATYETSWLEPGSMSETRDNLTLKFDHEITPDQHLRAMAYYGDYDYDQHWNVDGSLPGTPEIYRTQGLDKWLGEEVSYDWQVNKQINFLTGAEGTQALQAHQEDTDSSLGVLLNTNQSYNDAGVFVQADDSVTKWLTLTAGAREDQVQRLGTNFSPRLAAVITPNDADTIKALYGRAFREPNLYELFYAVPSNSLANPNLQPEICDTYELDWEHQFASGWRTTLDGYVWHLSNTISNVALPNNISQYQNIGSDLASGLEAEASKKWDTGGSFRIYGSVDRADHDGDWLTHSPQWIVGVSTTIPVINNRTFLSLEPQIVGGMKSDLGQVTSPTYITNIVMTSRDIRPGMDFQLGLYNLFGNYARLPRDNVTDQIQPTLRYPTPQLLASVIYRF